MKREERKWLHPSSHHQIRSFTTRHSHLLPHRRHPRPVVEDMDGPMLAKNREIIGLKPLLVPEFDPVVPALRQL